MQNSVMTPTPSSLTPTLHRVTRHTTLCTSVVAMLALSACQAPARKTEAVVAHPQIPTTQPYEIYDSQTVSRADKPSVAAQRWQDFYSDARLRRLIELALDNNKDINAAVLAIQKSRAQYQITDINDLPIFNGSASAARTGDFNGTATTRYNVGLALASYEFDFWGRIASLKEAALQDFLATAAAKDAVQISLISNIAQSYVAYSYNLAQLELARQTLKTREDSLRINRKRYEAGLDSQLTTVQAQSLVEAARVSIANAETNLLKNRNALRYLVGTPIDSSLLPPPAINSITNNRVFNAGLPSDLLLYRPDIRQAEHTLKGAGANIKAARAAFFPSIGLSGNVGTASLELSDLFKNGSFNWGITPTVSLPIFDAGRRRINYELAEITEQQALNNYEKSIQTAFKEVNDVFATRSTLKDQLAAYDRMLTANQKNRQIADARFKAGLDNYLNVLDAQRSIYSTQQSILNTRQAQLVSQIQLYQVLGGGVNLDVPLDAPSPRYQNASTVVTNVTRRVLPTNVQNTQGDRAVAITNTTTTQMTNQ